MLCFFHSSDLDGHCSGALVRRIYPDCTTVPINYGQPLILEKLIHHKEAFMVDFSFKPSDMMALRNKVDFVWIDHHISAIRDSEEHGYSDIKGIRNKDFAGCELTWQYLHPNEPMPKFVHYLGRFDVWDHYTEEILYFQYGLRRKSTWPDKDIWDKLLKEARNGTSELLDQLLYDGRVIFEYEEEMSARICKSQAYTIQFEGHTVLVLNRGYCNSRVFNDAFDPNVHEFVMSYSRYPSTWRVSLYQNDKNKNFNLDLSVFAKKRGGGGHAGAAGFETQDISELLP